MWLSYNLLIRVVHINVVGCVCGLELATIHSTYKCHKMCLWISYNLLVTVVHINVVGLLITGLSIRHLSAKLGY